MKNRKKRNKNKMFEKICIKYYKDLVLIINIVVIIILI